MLSRTALQCLRGSTVRIGPIARRGLAGSSDDNISQAQSTQNSSPITATPAGDRPDSSSRVLPEALETTENPAAQAANVRSRPVAGQSKGPAPTHRFRPRPGSSGQPTSLDYEKIMKHLLVHKRGVDHFNADLLTFELFKEMLDHKVAPSLQTLNVVLQLACEGTDSDRVSWVLDIFKKHWITLDGRQYVQIARHFATTRQFELGLVFLQSESETTGRKIPTQAFSALLQSMLKEQELEGAFELFRLVAGSEAEGKNVATVPWSEDDAFDALDAFAYGSHGQGIEFAWRQCVARRMELSSNLCRQILAVAGKLAMPLLATDVVKYMSRQKMAIAPQHYTHLVAAYTRAGDIKVAFSVLALMRKMGVAPLPTTAGSILRMISRDLDTVDRAWFTLLDLKESGATVDIAAVNCVIDASVIRHDLSRAMATYKEATAPVEEKGLDVKPNVETLNSLLLGCCTALERKVALELITEFREVHGIQANAATFEHLIGCVLLQPDYEAAFSLLEEMKQEGHQPSAALYKMLVCKLVAQGDERVKIALDEMRGWGYRDGRLERVVADGGVVLQSDHRISDRRQTGSRDGFVAQRQELRVPEISVKLVPGYQLLRSQGHAPVLRDL